MFPKADPVVLLDDNDPRAQSYSLEVDDIDDEMGQLTISMGEDESEFEDSTNALTQLEELAAGLETIHDSLAAAPNGADSLSLRLASHAQQTFARRAGIEIAGYSAESVGGNVTRKEATELAMESIMGTLKKAYDRFIALMKRIWDAFTSFMANVFQFFFSVKKRLEKLKARALQLKQANATTAGAPLQLPARLQFAFQLKGKPIDPVALVQDGQFVSKIENFGTAYVKYTATVLAELSSFIAETPKFTSRAVVPQKLKGLLNAESLITSSFKGQITRTPGQITSHIDIPGNRVVVVSSPVMPTFVFNNETFRKALTGIRVSVRPFEISAKPQTEIPHVTLDDVITICDESLRCLAAADVYNREVKRLMGERSRLLRSVGILYSANGVDVEAYTTLVSSITSSISRYCTATLGGAATWMNLMKRTVLQAGDVAFLAVKQYQGKDAKSGQNPFYTATVVEPLRISHAT